MPTPAPPGHIFVTFEGHEFTVPQAFYQLLVERRIAAPLECSTFIVTGFKEPEPEEING